MWRNCERCLNLTQLFGISLNRYFKCEIVRIRREKEGSLEDWRSLLRFFTLKRRGMKDYILWVCATGFTLFTRIRIDEFSFAEFLMKIIIPTNCKVYEYSRCFTCSSANCVGLIILHQ